MAEKMSESEKKKEDWMNSKWRPMMGWTYMITCIFDFVVAPILWSLTQSLFHGSVQTQWQPLTLQGAGLYHIAMGAVLGIAAYGRTQEKLGGANNGGINLPSNVGTTYTPPGAIQQPGAGGFGAPATGGWGTTNISSAGGYGTTSPGYGAVPPATGFGNNPGFGATASGFNSPSTTVTVSTGWGGKKVVPQQDDPLI
jgi:hypothetical protein